MEIAEEYLSIARDRICLAHPSLALILERIQPEPSFRTETFGTDGERILYNSKHITEMLANGRPLEPAILHAAAHCLLGHLSCDRGIPRMDIACDLSCAFLTEEIAPEYLPFLKDPVYVELSRHFRALREPTRLYEAFGTDPYFLSHENEITAMLRMDDHGTWDLNSDTARCGASSFWGTQLKHIRSGTRTGHGMNAGSAVSHIRLEKGEKQELAAYLKRYAVTRENARTDADSFQNSWYVFGLEHYGNIPLIEPTEYREERKLETLVIAVDTSGSCQRGLTQRFFEIVRDILVEEKLFFQRFDLRILQCDAVLQREDRITSLREFDRYIEDLTISGGGGTDFRPVFDRIDALRRSGELTKLRGMLYFSDGRGLFPSAPPAYDVSFVFLKHRFDAIDVPDWVHRIVLDAPFPKGSEYMEY